MSQLDEERAPGEVTGGAGTWDSLGRRRSEPRAVPDCPSPDVPDPGTECERYDWEPYGPSEGWAPMPGWPHMVSKVGGRTRSPAGRILKQRDSNRPSGDVLKYQLQDLICGTNRKTVSVHRCVLLAHRGEPKPGDEASHVDDVPTHNGVLNLVWETHRKNIQRQPPEQRAAAAATARAARSPRVTAPEPVSVWRRVLRWLLSDDA